MQHDHRTGRVDTARWAASPNFSPRPSGARVSALVVHCISLPPGCYGGDEIERFFCNRLNHGDHPYFAQLRGVTVSAHFLIRRGGALLQFVSTLARAWHAGRSCLDGVAEVNDFSIGVELEGAEDQAFATAQYDTLAALTRSLRAAYPAIESDRVVGHCDIAPGRKTDPGPEFDWARYRHAAGLVPVTRGAVDDRAR